MNIVFSTNLDEAKRYVPAPSSTDTVEIPAVGSRVRLRKTAVQFFDLEVVAVVHDFTRATPVVRVELHIPSHLGWSIREWSEWFTTVL